MHVKLEGKIYKTVERSSLLYGRATWSINEKPSEENGGERDEDAAMDV